MKMIAAIAVTVGGLVMAAGPVEAQNAHGSIAVGNTAYGEAVAYGFAWNYATKDDARGAALNACRAGGSADCAERASFQNGCGALAVGQYGNGGAKAAMTRDQAEARAVQTCEASGGSGCAVVGSQCASPGGEAGTWSGSEHVLAAPETDADERRAEVPAEAVRTPTESLTREQRVQVQRGLATLGFDTGPADGLFGPKTRAAIWDWQEAKGLEATGYLSAEQGEALGAISQEAEVLFTKPGSGSEPLGQQAHEESEESESKLSDSQNQVLRVPRCRDLYASWREGSSPRPPVNLGCWHEPSNQQDCDIFLSGWMNVFSLLGFTWSGSCHNNVGHGQGTIDTGDRDKSIGTLIEGKMQGHWVDIYNSVQDGGAYDEHEEGSYVDSVRQGHWVYREIWEGNHVAPTFGEGNYVDGMRQGRYTYENHYKNGRIESWHYECHRDDCKRVD